MKVSVIVPSFNRAEKLVETIESIESNNSPKLNMEIVVVDDCSTDRTPQVIRDLEKKYSNIKGITNKKNSGPAVSRNRGISISKGDLIFFTDDDCIVPNDWINQYVGFFKKHPEVYGAGGILEAKDKNIFSRLEKVKDAILGITYAEERIGNSEIKTGFTNNCVYRKEVFKKIGKFKENFRVPAGEDLEFSQRVASKYKIAFVPIKVLHNHKYDWNYFLGLMYKQGLGEMPPKKNATLLMIRKSPRLICNVFKKMVRYRK